MSQIVGIVIVSHSPDVARGAAAMVRQMVGDEVPCAFTGGNPAGDLGTDPIKKLVTPRVLAALIMLPVLTVINDFVGILGGNVIATLYLNLSSEVYWRTVWEQIALGGFTLRYIPNDFIQGLSKPFVFGGIIAITGCYFGLNTKGGTEGVGIATTRTVVTASIMILIIDYFMTQVILYFFAAS